MNYDNSISIKNIKAFNHAYYIFILDNNIEIENIFSGINYIIPWIIIVTFNFFIFFSVFNKNLSLTKSKKNKLNSAFYILFLLLVIQGIIPNIFLNIKYHTNIYDFLIIIISVLLEEFFFRFFLISIIFKKEKFFIANIVQSLLFCSFHILKTNIIFMLSLFFAGLIYGFIYKKYGLKHVILTHLFYNIIINIVLYIFGYAIFN